VIEVALQAVGVEAIPLKLTVLLPCTLRKFVPAITTEVFTAPVLGVRLRSWVECGQRQDDVRIKNCR